MLRALVTAMRSCMQKKAEVRVAMPLACPPRARAKGTCSRWSSIGGGEVSIRPTWEPCEDARRGYAVAFDFVVEHVPSHIVELAAPRDHP